MFIVLRKFSYLQRLSPEAQHALGPSFWHDLAPELFSAARNVKLREFGHNVLVETEKLLRRIRILFSTVDRWSETLIRKLRRAQRHRVIAVQKEEAVPVPSPAPVQAAPAPVVPAEPAVRRPAPRPNMELLKQEEQELIISIAQDPKNAKLYLMLGDILVKMKNFNDARESYETVLKLEPENEKAKKKISAVLEKMQKME